MSRRSKETASVAAEKGDRLAHVLRLGQQVVTKPPAPTAAINRVVSYCSYGFEYDDENRTMKYKARSPLVEAIHLDRYLMETAYDKWSLAVDIKEGNIKGVEGSLTIKMVSTEGKETFSLEDQYTEAIPQMIPAQKAELLLHLKSAKQGIYKTSEPYGEREKVFDLAIAALA